VCIVHTTCALVVFISCELRRTGYKFKDKRYKLDFNAFTDVINAERAERRMHVWTKYTYDK